MYLAIFTQFFAIFTQFFFVHPINLKGLVVFYIFQRLIYIFKDYFTKFQDNSWTKGTFLEFQFSTNKVKFKDFSRSVPTLWKTGVHNSVGELSVCLETPNDVQSVA